MTGSTDTAAPPHPAAWPERIAISPEEVLAQVSHAFGEPMLISVTGSLAAGYGNAESDIDVYVVVAKPVMQMPMVAYHEGLRIDVRYFTAAEVLPWTRTLRQNWPPAAGQGGRDPYVRRKGALHAAVRFAVGVDLHADATMGAWLADLRSGWLTDVVADWWTLEAMRRLTAARWLGGCDPAGADGAGSSWERLWMRHADAALAALEARVARAGHLFFGPKWLSVKLEQLGDAEGLADLDAANRFGPAEDLAAFAARCAAVVGREAGADAAWGWELRPASGVEVDDYAGRRLVSRWGLRGVEFPAGAGRVLDPLAEKESAAACWTGPLGRAPDAGLLDLFRADMLWLSLVGAPGGDADTEEGGH